MRAWEEILLKCNIKNTVTELFLSRCWESLHPMQDDDRCELINVIQSARIWTKVENHTNYGNEVNSVWWCMVTWLSKTKKQWLGHCTQAIQLLWNTNIVLGDVCCGIQDVESSEFFQIQHKIFQNL